ncbi:sulfatase-like hydrolase/transferase [Acinetobacter puyangensis]|uniref:Arylsulfatase A n=1 Tax=Acinetobacter puyangensis TaxID=1096779 RepID=A0A240E2N2_9GAMM|nr:sulfatase-like hydrolase/transferase [Acinetobacter puyangensis]SNX43028.1 Arylsulfatase A [Acinetobacter puyangensis]
MKPNFVIIVADQLRADALPAFGNAVVKTPHIDALAQQGIAFSQAFTQHSVCSPSRVSFISGYYPHVHGNRTLVNLIQPNQPNFLKDFKQHGYDVIHIGERGHTFEEYAAEQSVTYHGFSHSDRHNLKSFSQGKVFKTDPEEVRQAIDRHRLSRAFYHGRKEDNDLNIDTACVETVQQWVSKPKDKPWVLYIPLFDPHPPFDVEEPWFSMYGRDAMALPRQGQGYQPKYLQALRQTHGWDQYSDADWQEIKAVYYGMVSRFDDNVGKIRQAIQDHQLDENTYFVLFSDHGEYLGDYGVVEKWPSGVHECLTRTPLIISGKDIQQGKTSDALIELLDVFPTLLELAGIKSQHRHYGRSFKNLLTAPELPHREAVFSEGGFNANEKDILEDPPFPYDLKGKVQHMDPKLVGKVACIRTRNWTYVWRLYEQHELYDRHSDPHESINLIEDTKYIEIIHALRDQLLQWLLETEDEIPPTPRVHWPKVNLPTP